MQKAWSPSPSEQAMSAAFVWKHELQWTVDDARGTRREISEDPALGYVSSVAFLF